MDRRSFLRGSAALPLLVAGAVPAVAKADAPDKNMIRRWGARIEGDITRISCEPGDPGEVAYGKACADGKKITVWLDGVEQKCVTADSFEGWVKRPIMSDEGNMAFNSRTGEILHEIVHGDVRIELAEGKSWPRS